jgi:hypothetical protein
VWNWITCAQWDTVRELTLAAHNGRRRTKV